jgi:endonuclease G
VSLKIEPGVKSGSISQLKISNMTSLLLLFTIFLFSTTFSYNHLDLPECDTTQVIHHTGFSLQYSAAYKNPIWVSEVLTRQKVTTTTTDRNGTFKEDHSVVNGTAVPGDYVHSGFDKGHMAPAADMKWSEDAMHECFYMSNMSPQLPKCNRGGWSRLEDQVRKFVE